MPLIINARQLEKRDLELAGEIPAEELELTGVDEMIEVRQPVGYDVVAERLRGSILVQGQLHCRLDCQCVRCLRPFVQELDIDHWTCDVPLEGEEAVVLNNDCLDLTPYIREDILLAFPQHPLCERDCPGLLAQEDNAKEPASVQGQANGASGAWAELNKLKF